MSIPPSLASSAKKPSSGDQALALNDNCDDTSNGKKPSKFKRGPVTISWLIGMMVVMMMVMTTTMMKMVMMTVAFEVLALKREEKKGRKKKPVLSGQKLQLIR